MKAGQGLLILLIVASSTLYQISQKLIGRNVNPWIALSAAYLIAFLFTLLSSLFTGVRHFENFRLISSLPSIFLLALACVGIEAGYLFAYRHGGRISDLYTQSTACLCATLLLVGALFFGEPLSLKKVIGLCLAIAGIGLMNR